MSYLDDTEAQLRALLGQNPDDDTQDTGWIDEAVEYVKKKLVESYKNGLQAAKQRARFAKNKNKTSR